MRGRCLPVEEAAIASGCMDTAKALLELLRSGEDDWVSLDEVLWLVSEGVRSSAAAHALADVLRVLYGQGLMIPGELGNSGFEDWSGTPTDWQQRTLAEVSRLKWSPRGEGHWLRLTDQGLVKLRTLEGD